VAVVLAQECLPPGLTLPNELEQLRLMQVAIKAAANSGSDSPAQQQLTAADNMLLRFQVCNAAAVATAVTDDL
jgi:hypothetical protein